MGCRRAGSSSCTISRTRTRTRFQIESLKSIILADSRDDRQRELLLLNNKIISLPTSRTQSSTSILVLENHHSFFPIIIHPAPKHTATIEIKHYFPLPINQLYTNNAPFSFTSLTPTVSSRPFQFSSRTRNLIYRRCKRATRGETNNGTCSTGGGKSKEGVAIART